MKTKLTLTIFTLLVTLVDPKAAFAAIGTPTSVGQINGTTSGTTLVVTVLAGGVAAGNTIIVTFAMNPATAGTVSVSDTKGNTYTSDADVSGTPRTIVLSAPVTTALASGDKITITHPSVTRRAASVYYVGGLVSASRVDQTHTGTGSSSSPSSGTSGTLSQANELCWGAIGGAYNSSTTFTAGGGYTALTSALASSSSSSSSATIQPEYKIVSATTATNASGTLSTSRAWAAAIVTYKAPIVSAANSTVTVNPGAGVAADGVAASTITVTVKDTSNNPMAGQTVTLAVTGSGNTVSTPAVTDVNGQTTATLKSTVAGTKTVTASVGATTITQQPPVTFVPGAASKLVMKTEPSASATAGVAFTTQPAVYVEDAFGNVVTTDGSTVTAALNTGSGPLQGTVTATAVNGVATFSNLADNKAESITLKFTDGSLTGVTDATTIVVNPAAIASYVVSAATPQASGTPFTTTVTAKDSFGNTVTTDSSTVVTMSGSTTNVQFDSNGNGTYGNNTKTLSSGTFSINTMDNLQEAVTITATDASSRTGSANVVIQQAHWYDSSWAYRLKIIINHTNVFGTDQTNFPVLINLTNASLSAHALANGYDMLFTASDGTNKLSYEREKYTGSNGALVAWVRVPIVSHTTDTVLYLYCGNAGATDQQQATNVWDSNFEGVWHLKEATGATSADSTTNANNGMPTNNPVQISGEIDGALSFNGINQEDDVASTFALGANNVTMETWAYLSSTNLHGAFIKIGSTNNSPGSGYGIGVGTGVYETNGNRFLILYETTRWIDTGKNFGTGWHHVVAVIDALGHPFAYLDGVQVYTDTGNAPLASSNNLTHIGGYIGINGTTPVDRHFNGILDEVRITSGVRSAGWIQTEYTNQVSPTTFISIGAEQTESTTTTISSSANPSTYGSAATFTATVSGSGGTPTGTVQFKTNGVNFGSAVTLSGGSATSIALPTTLPPGSYTVTAVYSGDGYFSASTSGALSQTVNPGTVSKLVFTSLPVTTAAGVASTSITVQRQDSYGNPVTTGTTSVALSSSSTGTVTFTPASPVSINNGSSSVSFTYTDTKAGTPTITAANSGLTSGTQAETVNPAAASRLVFTSTAVTTTAGVASTSITVQRQDQYGNPNTTDASRTVTLASTSGGTVTFTPSSLTISSGSSSATFTYTDTQAGTPTITAASTSPNTITSATQVETVTAAAASKLVFTTSAFTNTAGVVSSSITVQRQDASGNPVTAEGTRTVTLSSSSTGTKTFAPTSLSILTNTSSASFTYTDTQAGTPTITAASTSPNTITLATQVETVTAAAASQLVVTTQPSASTVAGVAFATQPVVKIEDAFGNVLTSGSDSTVSVALTKTTGTGSLTGTASMNAVAGVADFAGKGLKIDLVGTDKVLTATATVAAGIKTTTTSPAFTITFAAASQLVFTSTAVTTTAGVASGSITVQRQDQYGNPTTAGTTNVTLSSSSSGTVTFTPASPVSINNGSSSVSFTYTDTKAGTPTITAANSGLTSGTQAETVNPAAASKLAFTTEPGNGTGGSPLSTQPAVTLQDAFGNTVTGTAQNVTVAIQINAGGGTLSGTKTVAVNTSTGVATFSGLSIDKGGNGYTLTATGSTVDTTAGTVVSSAFNITVGAAAQLAFTTQPGGGTGGMAWSQQPVVTVEDAGGNTVTSSSASITLTTTIGTPACGGPGTLSGTTTLGASSGVATFSGLSINAAGTGYELHATSPGLTAVDSSPFNVAGSPVTFNFTLSDSAGDAASGQLVATNNGNNIFTVFSGFYDGTAGGVLGTYTLYPNPTPPGSTTSPAGAFIYDDQLLPSADPKLNNSGLLFTSGTTEVNLWGGDANGNPTPGVYSLYSSGGYTYQFSGNLTLTLLQSAAARLAFTTQPGNGTGGSAFSTQPAVTLQDLCGNAVTGTVQTVTVAIWNNAGGGTLSGTATAAVDPNTGVATFSGLSIDKIGTNYTLTATGSTVDTTAGVVVSGGFNITAAAASQLVFTSTAVTTTAGTASGSITVQRQDQYGNPTTAGTTNVTLSSSSSGTVTFTPASPVSINNGSSSVSFTYTDTKAGTPTITAANSGLTSGTQAETVTAAAASKLAYTTVPGTGTAGTAFSVTVQSQDTYGNPANLTNATTITLSKATGGGTLSGTLTGSIGSGTNSVTIATPVYSKSDTMTLTATASGGVTLTAVTSGNIVFSAGAATATTVETAANGSGSVVGVQNITAGNSITVYAITRDANGNFVANPSATWSLQSITGSVVSGDLAGGTGSAVFTGHLVGTAIIRAVASGFTGNSGTQTVIPGALDHFAVTTPGTQTAGTAFAITTITAQDANNNTVTSFVTTVALTETGSGAGGTVSPATSSAFTLGVLSGQSVTLSKSGAAVTITATGSAKTGVSGAFLINPGVLDHFAVTTPATQAAGTAFAIATITAQDANNNTVKTFVSTVALTETGDGAGGTVSPATSSAFTLGVLSGQSVTLSKSGAAVTITATGSAKTGVSGTFLVSPGPMAMPMTVTRTAGLTLKIAWSDVATNWSESVGGTVTLSGLNLVTTNQVHLTTNSTWILYTNSPNVNDQITYTINDGLGRTNPGVINVVINPFVTGQNTTVTVSNGTATVKFYGKPGLTYVTQRSTNLVNWVSIATNTVSTNGVINVTDTFGDLGGPPASAYYWLGWSP